MKKIFFIIDREKKKYHSNKRLMDSISKYKYIHLIINDCFCCPFVEFINDKFDRSEHLFLVQRAFSYLKFPDADNVMEIRGMRGLDFSSNHIEKVITHSLFLEGIVNYWYWHRKVLREKTYWMIWGGDLYDAKRNKREDYVRSNFKGYISDTDGDCDIVKKNYHIQSDLMIEAGYTFPITGTMIEDALKNKNKHKYIQIQINNSSDKSTLEMLEILSKYSDENIRVRTVLSYGDLEYKEKIIALGKKIFKKNFSYIDEYLPPEKYAEVLAENDIYILNQDRQQGLGNSFATLAVGAKLFIKSSVTTFTHFNDRGIVVYDTYDIKNITYDEFISYNENIKRQNMDKVKCFFENEYLKELWIPVFN